MKLRTIQSIENENYIFVFDLDQDSISTDAALIQKFGQPAINFGGVINVYSTYNADGSGVSTLTSSFTLPDIYFKLPSEFPVKQVFSTISPSVFSTNTAARMQAYRNKIEYSVSAAVVALRNVTDSFTGEFLVNI